MLKDKFMTICTGCDGDGKLENEVLQMGEVKYYYTKCDCENGKELDWQKVNLEIKLTQNKISTCKMRDGIYNEVLRELYDKQLTNLFADAVKQLIENERELVRLEEYLEQLETID
jgi:hypothetical protein